ncbi:MAG: hypothetical protein ACR2Q4_05555, partial [Geminicoccaceae bacterium]
GGEGGGVGVEWQGLRGRNTLAVELLLATRNDLHFEGPKLRLIEPQVFSLTGRYSRLVVASDRRAAEMLIFQ